MNRLAWVGLFLIYLLFSFAAAKDIDSLQVGLRFLINKKMELQVSQYQYGHSYESTLNISIIDSVRYHIQTPDQEIYAAGNEIKTWNKKTDQLIIDTRLEQDIDIFRILTGDLMGMVLTNKQNDQNGKTFDFSFANFGIIGSIVVNREWHLEKMKINYDKNNWIVIQIQSWKLLMVGESFSEFGAGAVEVLDFRE